MAFNKNSTVARRVRALRPLALALKPPDVFTCGLPRPMLELPTNLVLFCRHFRGPMPHGVPNANLDQTVLVLCLDGAGTVRLDDRDIHLHVGRALLIFPHQIHAYHDLDRDRLVWLYLSFQVGHTEALAALRNAPLDLSPAALALAREMVVAYRQRNAAEPARAAELTVTLWRLLLELLSLAGPARPSGMSPQMEARLSRIQQHIVDHIREPIRLQELARELGVSESKLCGDFRRSMRVSLGTFIRRWRVFYACRLMRASLDSLTQVAEQCGFGSVYAFSRTFKQVMRIAPRDWRQRQDRDRVRRV